MFFEQVNASWVAEAFQFFRFDSAQKVSYSEKQTKFHLFFNIPALRFPYFFLFFGWF